MEQPKGIGARVPRVEDDRFLRGHGRFTDDLVADGQALAVFLRSSHAHARILGIEAEAARAAPGVRLVLTAADILQDIPNPIPSLSNAPPFDIARRPDGPAAEADQYPLAQGEVRYVGEPLACVVADTLSQARDAAELIEVDYAPLPVVLDMADALAEGAPRVWHEKPDNLSFAWERGDAEATDAAFARAAHVARVELVNNRVAISFMEPRAALAEYDAGEDRLTLRAGCQSAHGMQAGLAGMLGLEVDRLRVVVPDTGGGFGARGGVYPEFPVLLVAARRLRRPVKWCAERAESFLADNQSRDHVLRGELALDAEGGFTALRVAIEWRHGAYLTSRNIWVMVAYLPPTLGGPYRIPLGHVALRGVFSNTVPLGAYRGIGRLESNYLMESLVDAAARVSGIDRIELRRRNLVAQGEMPWETPGGAVYELGEFATNLEQALELSDWDGVARRREAAEARGLLKGIGLAMYVENDGGVPSEYAEIVAGADGTVTAHVGTQDFGMGHATMYGQILSSELGIEFERIRVVFGDTDRIARGAGSHGSRSARIGGAAAVGGAQKLVELGRELASEMLEASAGDIEYRRGRFVVAGTDRAVGLAALAGFAEARGGRLAGETDFTTERQTHANGCHVCEVSIDPEDGRVTIDRYGVVADVGRAINPMIVDGQIHGGAAQGIGQALMEEVIHDPASGQVLSGSYMDYTLPRADDLANFAVALNEQVETDNPLGVKGAGESATTGAPGALMNAIRDALGPAAGHLDMPATPERVRARCGGAGTVGMKRISAFAGPSRRQHVFASR